MMWSHCCLRQADFSVWDQSTRLPFPDGQVYTWGQDSRGQLGLGKKKHGANSPQQLRSLSSIPLVQIAAGGEQSFALSVSGGVFSWGRNDCGQLGLGDTTDRHTPTLVHHLNMKKTTHISCGMDHTAILTKDGVVFTFGSGQHGQLGHNSFRNELHPRLVAELWGAKIIKIACGRHHTLVMTDSRRVYSFGCGEQGQLGHGEESHPSVPLPVQLPQDTTDVPQITNIYAGGNCSFATCSSNEEVHKESNSDSMSNIAQHCLDGLIDNWTSDHNSKSWKKTKQQIKKMFSSASCMNQSFLDRRNDKHFQTSQKYSGLNLSVARLAFQKLVKKDDVWAEVEAAVTHLISSLVEKPVGVEGLRIYLLLIEFLSVMQKHKRQPSTNLAGAVAAAVVRLSADNLQVIVDWWSSLSSSTMVKYVNVWKQTLSAILSSFPVPRNTGVKNLLLILQCMYNKEHQQLFGWVPQINPHFFELKLKRASLLEGAFKQLAAADHSALKKPLVVYFDEDPKLTDVYKRDFFHHLFHEMVSANSGMFMFNDSKTLAWFPSNNAVYEFGYHVSHPNILMFWEVFDELTEDQRKDFIWFLTGFRRAPILGMDQIQMRIRVKQVQDSSVDQLFPESLTCHSILELPLYPTKEIMRDKLTEALMPERGFLNQSHSSTMFSWGEDSQGGFRLKDGSGTAGDGVNFLNLGFDITDLSAGHSVLAFIKRDGNAFIIRTNESNDGRRVRGKQSEHLSVQFLT
ncbi:hypothetical protein PAMP_019297 [Pampus punctatissimus]